MYDFASGTQSCVDYIYFSFVEQPSENMVLRGERQEGSEEESVNQTHTVNFSCTEEHVNDSSADTGGDRVSEGKGNLKEIADILLMLKQKNKHP